jgi:DNA polymerase
MTGAGFEHTVEEVKKVLGSTPKFRSFLENRGIEVETKVSPTTGKKTPALAKTDPFMESLLEHEDELVRAAAEARLDVKSTILETRIRRFIKIANMFYQKMPIALRYYGADTTGRYSGTFKLNQQNLPRVGKKAKISDVLRKSLRAPEGYQVVVADLSGIEMRVNHFLWKVPYSTELWTNDPKADLYRAAGERWHGRAITDEERHVEKIKALGLGFGAGAATFKSVARVMGGLTLTDEEATAAVNSWRNMHHEIVNGWRTCHGALQQVLHGGRTLIDPWGMCSAEKGRIVTPKGQILYPSIHIENDPKTGKPEYWYGTGRNRARIYAGKVTENIVQHLARHVITDVMLAFAKTDLGKKYRLAHTVHDELVYVVKDKDAQDVLDQLQVIMRTPPQWWPELCTWSEGGLGQTYGDAK